MNRIAGALLLLLAAWSGHAEDFTGRCVGVVAGDTIQVLRGGQPETIRLAGVDAPEITQPFGPNARKALADAILGKDVLIKPATDKPQDRARAVVIIAATNMELNASLVRNGWAWHESTASKEPCLAECERLARQGRLGLWRDAAPQAPWEYRRAQSQATATLSTATLPNITVQIPRDGKTYHQLGCMALAGGSTEVPLRQIAGQGYTPCHLCQPAGWIPAAPAQPAAPTLTPAEQQARAIQVQQKQVAWLAMKVFRPANGKRYHKKGCKVLKKKKVTAMTRAQAQTVGLLPCPECRPD